MIGTLRIKALERVQHVYFGVNLLLLDYSFLGKKVCKNLEQSHCTLPLAVQRPKCILYYYFIDSKFKNITNYLAKTCCFNVFKFSVAAAMTNYTESLAYSSEMQS